MMDVVTLGMAKADAKKNYSKRGAVSSPAQIASLMHKLKGGVEAAVITALGDSTGAMVGSWLNGLVQQKLGAAFPNYSLIQRDFDSANERYNPVTTIVQTGTAGLRRYVGTGASTDAYFTVPDSAATSPTGDLDVRFKVTIAALGAQFTLGGKYDTATNNRAWFVQVNANGTISLFFSTDGTSTTQLTRSSTVTIPPAAVGVPVWIRATFDVDDGAGNNVARFYYSADNSTWTQIGSTVTNAGVQSIFDAAAPTQLNSRGGTANSTGGVIEYHGMQLYTSLAATARPAIDIITGLWHGYFNANTFTDLVGNTVSVGATGTTGSMQGAPIILFLNGCVSGSAIALANDATRFPKLTPVPSDVCFINYSHNEVGSVSYRAPFKQLADAVLAKWTDCGIIAVVQNKRYSPATNINEHQIRGDQIAALAASQRYGLINAFAILESTGNQVQYINTDGIHPTIAATAKPGYGPGADVIRDGAWPLFSAWL